MHQEQVELNYSCPTSTGEISTSVDNDGYIWVYLTGRNNVDFYAGILPDVYAAIESRFGLRKESAQDFPKGTEAFEMVVVYSSTDSVDTEELANMVKELIEQ